MYRWRKLTDEERRDLLEQRWQRQHPAHSPFHFDSGDCCYHITAACFDHVAHIGHSMERMNGFASGLLDTLHEDGGDVIAWVLLPNHYHALVRTGRVLALLKALGRLHGRTSHTWNGEENTRGRQVWCKAVETVMKSEGHYFATINYIHHNPVKHRYVKKWTDWPWSSAAAWLATHGREATAEQWTRYPVKEYGAGWDDAGM